MGMEVGPGSSSSQSFSAQERLLERAKNLGGPVGNVAEKDLFLTAPLTNDPLNFHWRETLEQSLSDCKEQGKRASFLQLLARVCGKKMVRCMANLVSSISGGRLFDAHRAYGVLPPQTLLTTKEGMPLVRLGKQIIAADLAECYRPKLWSISEEQAQSTSLAPSQMRYEVLPPKDGKNEYTVIYYIKREQELALIPVLSWMYQKVKPFLFASKSEWNAVQVDIDRNTALPKQISFESSNYTADPQSFESMAYQDMNLVVTIEKRESKWVHTLYQKNQKAKAQDVAEPFASDNRLELVFTNWHGSLDVKSMCEAKGYQSGPKRLMALQDAPMSFLDIDTYRTEAMDLREVWLERRKASQCQVLMPKRKDGYEVRNPIPQDLAGSVANIFET